MAKKIFAIIGLAAGWMITAGAHADVGMVGEVGTTGIGGHVVIPLNRNVDARLGMGYLNYSYSGRTRDMNYDLSLKTKTYDALLDWHPWQDNAFRLTTGLAFNGNKISAQGRPNAAGNYTINDNTYDAASVGKVNGNVDFGKISPYLGIGWDKSAEKGWSFSTDLGVLFQGSPHTTLTSSGCTTSAAMCERLASDMTKENSALADEVSRFKVYPVLRVGISYKF